MTDAVCTQPVNGQPVNRTGQALVFASLFAGIGGFDRGLQSAGHECQLLCEIDPVAQSVLRAKFPQVRLVPDVRLLEQLSDIDLLTAGFPCQDLSSLGLRAGIEGQNSGLVSEVFRLLETSDPPPRWVLFENVPFMLRLDRGRAMSVLTYRLEQLGYQWAYRVVDSRAFGLPQRRLRVFLLASRTDDPRDVLFADDVGEQELAPLDDSVYGFYWTEGNTGVGWAVDAIPTLKSGSGLGIPSPPAIWLPREQIAGTPNIRDAERLQGFPADWTSAAIIQSDDQTHTSGGARTRLPSRPRQGARWRLVGNAISVPVAQWLGERLRAPGNYDEAQDEHLSVRSPWPAAAWGRNGKAHKAAISTWPVHRQYHRLRTFLECPVEPLSIRSTAGFLKRARASRLNFADGFLDGLTSYLEQARRGNT